MDRAPQEVRSPRASPWSCLVEAEDPLLRNGGEVSRRPKPRGPRVMHALRSCKHYAEGSRSVDARPERAPDPAEFRFGSATAAAELAPCRLTSQPAQARARVRIVTVWRTERRLP